MEVPAGLPMQAEGTGRFGTGTSGTLFVCRTLQTEGGAAIQPAGYRETDRRIPRALRVCTFSGIPHIISYTIIERGHPDGRNGNDLGGSAG